MSVIDDFLDGPELAVSEPIVLGGAKGTKDAKVRKVWVRELSGMERALLDNRRYKRDGDRLIWDRHKDDLHWAVACLCDQDGKRLFDIDWEKSAEIDVACRTAGKRPDHELNAISIQASLLNAYAADDVRNAAKKWLASPMNCLRTGWLLSADAHMWPECWPV